MAIIKQYDKRSGITYAQESHSYWALEKKMTRAKRKLIGRIDPETGEIVPTDGRNRKKKDPADPKEKDYKKLYNKLLQRCEAQVALIDSMGYWLCWIYLKSFAMIRKLGVMMRLPSQR